VGVVQENKVEKIGGALLMAIQLKRIYESSAEDDGIRILVDRLWPRGVSKEKAKLDYWLKDIGPSHELRKWFNHDPDKFSDFKKRYQAELESGEQNKALKKLKAIVTEHKDQKNITLLFATREVSFNHVVVLLEILNGF